MHCAFFTTQTLPFAPPDRDRTHCGPCGIRLTDPFLEIPRLKYSSPLCALLGWRLRLPYLALHASDASAVSAVATAPPFGRLLSRVPAFRIRTDTLMRPMSFACTVPVVEQDGVVPSQAGGVAPDEVQGCHLSAFEGDA